MMMHGLTNIKFCSCIVMVAWIVRDRVSVYYGHCLALSCCSSLQSAQYRYTLYLSELFLSQLVQYKSHSWVWTLAGCVLVTCSFIAASYTKTETTFSKPTAGFTIVLLLI